MDTFVSWIGKAFALLATIPFLTFFILYLAGTRFIKDRKRAFRLSVDVTTVLLIMAVGALWQYISASYVSWWAALALLTALYVLLAALQIWIRGRISWRRLLRRGWRIAFIIFAVMYVVFFIIGIGQTFFA